MTMRFIHFADAHIGVTTHGRIDKELGLNDRVLDFLNSLDYVVHYVRNTFPDAVLFAGDAFHNNHPLSVYVSEFALRIKEMAEVCPVVLIPGNHDFSKSVSALDVIGVLGASNNVITSDEPICRVIRTKSGDLCVACFPYPVKSKYLDIDFQKQTDDQLLIHANYQVRIAEEIEALAEEAVAKRLPSILLAHLTVGGALWKPGQIATDLDADISLETLHEQTVWDYVALGHLHYPQDLSKKTPVVYSGSIDRVDFGEEDLPKGFFDVTIDDKGSVWYDFEEIPTVRPMVTLKIDVRGQKQPVSKILKKVEQAKISNDALLRVMIDVDHGVRVPYNDVHERLKHVYRVTSINTLEERLDRPSNLHQDDQRSLISMTPLEVLDAYFHAQGYSEDETDDLLDLFEELNPDA